MKLETLNTRCRIEYKSITQDPVYGTEIVSWVPLGVRWCHLQDEMPSRSERAQNGLVVATKYVRCRLNYSTDIDSSMRIIVNRPDPVIYEIVSPPAILGDRERIEVMLQEVTS